MPLLSEARLHQLVQESLALAGLNEREAASCADASVFADLRGSSTHGIVYILRRTLESMRNGATVSGAQTVVVRDNAASALVKGAGVAGPVLATSAMDLAIDKASRNGIGFVNTFNGNPIGLLGYYANRAAERGLIGIVMANTAPSAAPYGATSPVLGTNPFAYAAPMPDGRAMIFDVATTVASAGKLQGARRRKEQLPPDWVIDREGRPIVDPSRADEGAMVMCGGHKGSGFGILIHLLTGGLSETTVGGDPTHNHPDPARKGQGAVFMAIDPRSFGSLGGFARMVEQQAEYIHAATPLPGGVKPRYPGERGWAEMDARRQAGIPVTDEDWAVVLRALADSKLPTDRLLAHI